MMQYSFRLRLPTAILACVVLSCLPLRAQDRVTGDAPLANGRTIAPLTDTERNTRRAVVRRALAASVRTLDRKIVDPAAVVTTRDLANGALAHLLLDGNASSATALLQRELDTQQMDRTLPGFGKLPWQTGPAVVEDDNAIEFGTQAWGPILLQYGDRLPALLKASLIDHARAALSPLRHHNVKASYTNIFLMKTVCLILLGEALHDTRAAGDGYALLDQWLDYTRNSGIHEFGSPTYYSTSLNSLLYGYRFAGRTDAHARFAAALNLFWTDIAAHYFAGRQDLSGPHSRDYDFLQGEGGTDLSLYAEGLREYKQLKSIDLEKVALALNLEPGGYHPSPGIVALAARAERTSIERWDDGIAQVRYTYLTPQFSLGSTSTNYGPQDKPVNLEIASPTVRLPEITVVADDSDQPYGKREEKDKSGHNKPLHLPLNPVAVQERGTLLLLSDVAARPTDPTALSADLPTSLATNILLPAQADAIAVNGKPLAFAFDRPFTHPLALGDVVGVRVGTIGVAVRIVSADGLDNKPPLLTLQADAIGLRNGVCRLTAYHAQGAPLPGGSARAETLILVALCPSTADFAALQARAAAADVNDAGSDLDTWHSLVTIEGHTLSAAYDLHTRKPLERLIDGKPIAAPALLTVDGVEIGASYLSAVPTATAP